MGVLTLDLLNDRSWIHRCVDKLSYSDPVTIRRVRSIDFTLPSHCTAADGEQYFHVPLGMLNKWRLSHIDLRQENGAALPLAGRDVHGPIAAAALMVLGQLVKTGRAHRDGTTTMPDSIEAACWEIATNRIESAIGACEELATPREGECECTLDWRRVLSTDERFMGLAWELARGFILTIPLEGGTGRRRVVKFGCDARRYRPRVSIPFRIRRLPSWLSATLRPEWRKGRIHLRSTRTLDLEGTQIDPTVCGAGWIHLERGPEVRRVRLRQDRQLVRRLSPGEWRVRQLKRPGYAIVEPALVTVSVAIGTTREAEFHNVREPSHSAMPPPPLSRLRACVRQRLRRGMPEEGVEVGRLLLRAVRSMDAAGTTTDPAADGPLRFRLRGPSGEHRSVVVRNRDETIVEDLAAGAWSVTQRKRRRYTLTTASTQQIEVVAGITREVVFENELQRENADGDHPVDLPRDSLLRRLREHLAIRSRRILLSGRVEGGGSYHFEFEAPAGFAVTRAKLSAVGRESDPLDITLTRTQRCHLYVPAPAPSVASGGGRGGALRTLVLINIRPRWDTLINTSLMIAAITAGVITVAAHWLPGVKNPSIAISVLIASPGALAAFSARAPDDPVIGRLTAGLRLMALLPGLVAFLAAGVAAMAALQHADAFGQPVPVIDPGTATHVLHICAWTAWGIYAYWLVVAMLIWRPPECWTFRPLLWVLDKLPFVQAPESWKLHSPEHARGIRRPPEPEPDLDPMRGAYDLRKRLRMRALSIPNQLRDEYFGPRGRITPSLFVEGPDSPPTFWGLGDAALDAQLADAARSQ